MVALRIALDIVKILRYMLRMMGVEVLRPAIHFGKNDSMVKGGSIPHHKLPKKHLGIYDHAVREAYVAVIWTVCLIGRKQNISKCLTKILPGTTNEKENFQWVYFR